MTHTVAECADSMRAAEQRLAAETPRTEGWTDAQIEVRNARLDYWAARRLEDDRYHMRRTTTSRPLTVT